MSANRRLQPSLLNASQRVFSQVRGRFRRSELSVTHFIRKFVVRASRLQDLVGLGSLSDQAARFLDASVRAGLNILVAGGTQAGKTTFLNCLAASIPGEDRVISAEEVYELRFNHPDCQKVRYSAV